MSRLESARTIAVLLCTLLLVPVGSPVAGVSTGGAQPGASAAAAAPPATAAQLAFPAKKAKKKSKKKTRKKSTRVVGWKAARRSPLAEGRLDLLRVTGPGGRSVKVQKRERGRGWQTVRVVKTSANQRVNVGFIREIPGLWRLRVPARKSWRAKSTRALRISSVARVPAPAPAARPSSIPSPVSRPVTPTPAPAVSVSGVSGAYGSSYNMDTLANMQVGGSASGYPNTYVSYRFRAERSDDLVAFRAYWLGAAYPGYGGGTGGTIRVSVEADSGGVPSGDVLAYADVVRPSQVFPLVSFPRPAGLVSGRLYHLVFTNIDPSPTVNFSSVDLSFVFGETMVPRQPNASDGDYAALRKFGTGSWRVESRYTPIVDLAYAGGSHQGRGYMEVEVRNTAVISGSSSMVRERLTVTGGSRVVSGAAVRVARSSGSGNLVVRLEDAGGAVIDSFSVSTASVPVLSSGGSASGVWVWGSFSRPVTLVDGATYNLRLSTDSSTSLWTRGIQQGDAYGFDKATYFSDGFLQITTNGGTSWSTVSGLGASGDLQFYLR